MASPKWLARRGIDKVLGTAQERALGEVLYQTVQRAVAEAALPGVDTEWDEVPAVLARPLNDPALLECLMRASLDELPGGSTTNRPLHPTTIGASLRAIRVVSLARSVEPAPAGCPCQQFSGMACIPWLLR